MQAWRWKKSSGRTKSAWRERRGERFSDALVKCALGTVGDLSATGMRVLCEGKPPVRVGGVLPTKLRFADGSLALKAQVRWCRRRGFKRHEIGLHFIELKPGTGTVLEAVARFGIAEAAKSMGAEKPDPKPAGSVPKSGTKSGAKTEPPPNAGGGKERKAQVSFSLPNYFLVLGLEPDATEADIKASYRKLAVTCHPDRSSDPDAKARFEAINEAYHILSDPNQRAYYLRMAG